MGEIDAQRRAEREGARAEPRVHAHATETSEITRDPSWETVTMAGILAKQGHGERAREIYRSILEGDPANEAARAGIAALDR